MPLSFWGSCDLKKYLILNDVNVLRRLFCSFVWGIFKKTNTFKIVQNYLSSQHVGEEIPIPIVDGYLYNKIMRRYGYQDFTLN